MRRVVGPVVTILVMVLIGRPVLGQGRTVRPKLADSLVGTWVIDEKTPADPEVIVLRSDSTVLMGGHRHMALDTFAWFTKDHWSIANRTGDIWIVMGREFKKQGSNPGNDRANDRGHAHVWMDAPIPTDPIPHIKFEFMAHRYKRGDSAVSLVNRLHPRPVPAPTGTLAQLLGTWEQQDSVSKDGRVAISRSTIRADSTVVKTVVSMQGTDTVSSETHLETVIVSGDTLWWGGWFDPNAKPRRIGRGRRVVLQDDQLTLFKVETPTVPDQVYRRVVSPTPP